MTSSRIKSTMALVAVVIAGPVFDVAAAAKPLKVYILAGQSNMEGQARIETFDYIGDDPATAPMLKKMRGPDGRPRVCERAWISYLTGSPEKGMLGEGVGRLTTGYGARSDPAEDGGKIGPEFMFGITMEEAHDGPVLIIKTAWGGKSLNIDFRSPGAGPYEAPGETLEMFARNPGGHGIPEDIDQWKADKAKKAGVYYRLMIDHAKKVLGDIKRVCPDYDPKQGYELAGFVWFQGWNDMCDSHTYPHRNGPGRYDEYSRLMAHFIRDVRRDLSAPKMPFVIGVIGVHGDQATGGIAELRPAMTAPAAMAEFKGNVAAVQTAPYYDMALEAIEQKHSKVAGMAYFLRTQHEDHPNKDGKMTPEQQRAYLEEYRASLITPEEDAFWERAASHQGYHYFGSAKTMALIGQAFAEALLEMEGK